MESSFIASDWPVLGQVFSLEPIPAPRTCNALIIGSGHVKTLGLEGLGETTGQLHLNLKDEELG